MLAGAAGWGRGHVATGDAGEGLPSPLSSLPGTHVKEPSSPLSSWMPKTVSGLTLQDEGWCVTHATSGLVAQDVSLPSKGSLPRSMSTRLLVDGAARQFVSGFGAGIWLGVQRTWPVHRRGPGHGLEQRLGFSLRQRSREMARGGASIGSGAGPVGAGGRGGRSPGPREQQRPVGACGQRRGSSWAVTRLLPAPLRAPRPCCGLSAVSTRAWRPALAACAESRGDGRVACLAVHGARQPPAEQGHSPRCAGQQGPRSCTLPRDPQQACGLPALTETTSSSLTGPGALEGEGRPVVMLGTWTQVSAELPVAQHLFCPSPAAARGPFSSVGRRAVAVT